MNANDHVPMVNIMPFGFCKKGMPCMPVMPVAWVDVNKKHIIEGAPALTEDSKLACAHGGVISIVPLDAGSAEEGDRNENAEDVVEEIASAALSILGSIAAKRIPFMKKLVKMRSKKKSVKGGGNKGSGSNSVENSGAASNRSLDRSGNSGGGKKELVEKQSTWLDNAKTPQDYLDQALKRQNLNQAPNRFKEKWSEGGFDFEIRIHPAEPQYGKQGNIYRVARRRQGVDENGQGFGWEYMDQSGGWHRTSTLKPQNPGYNEQAARDTHIQLP